MKTQKIKSISIEGVVEERPSASIIFVEILNTICSSPDEETLRAKMKHFEPLDRNWYYDYGFGNHHMWVSRTDTDERIILVEFEQ